MPTTEGSHLTGIQDLPSLIMMMMMLISNDFAWALGFDISGVYDEEGELPRCKVNCELLPGRKSETLRCQGVPVVNVIMLDLTRANLHSCWSSDPLRVSMIPISILAMDQIDQIDQIHTWMDESLTSSEFERGTLRMKAM